MSSKGSIKLSEYANGGVAIVFYNPKYDEDEIVSVWLDPIGNTDNTFYYDRNNLGEFEKEVVELLGAELIGSARSGFCDYPLYKFDREKFKE